MNTHQKLKELERNIIKPEYRIASAKEMLNETIVSLKHAYINELPAVIITTESKKIFVHTLVHNLENHEDYEVKPQHINIYRLIYLIANNEIDHINQEPSAFLKDWPFINVDVLNEYRAYQSEKYAIDKEKEHEAHERELYERLREKYGDAQ